MASAGLQLLGFFLSLFGLAAIVASTFMVEWKSKSQGNEYHVYTGLWMKCSGHERTTCEVHHSILELPIEFQVTRGVMLLSIFFSILAVLVSSMGMKCTHFMDGNPKSKATTAMLGGILFILAGLTAIIISSWFVKKIIQSSGSHHDHHHLESSEFGKAVFVSWAGGLLTVVGGALLSCRRCSRSRSSGSISGNHLFTPNNQKSNYV